MISMIVRQLALRIEDDLHVLSVTKRQRVEYADAQFTLTRL